MREVRANRERERGGGDVRVLAGKVIKLRGHIGEEGGWLRGKINTSHGEETSPQNTLKAARRQRGSEKQ